MEVSNVYPLFRLLLFCLCLLVSFEKILSPQFEVKEGNIIFKCSFNNKPILMFFIVVLYILSLVEPDDKQSQYCGF